MARLRLPGRRGRAGRAGGALIRPRLSAREVLEELDPTAARSRVARIARRTPLVPSTVLSERVGRPVLVKLECLQLTGSFKVRGAAARLGALDEGERRRGVVACSSGNHGRAVARVARILGVPATIFVPGWVDPVKLDGIRGDGAEAVLAGDTYDEAEARALERAREEERPFVSAYDDPWVIAGQGTLALEILEQMEAGIPGWLPPGSRPAFLLAPLSGGGLVGGMAAAVHPSGNQGTADTPGAGAPRPPVLVAVSAHRARVMLESVRAGEPLALPEEETLASALAGGIGEENRWSFPLIRELVAEHTTVTEDEIEEAIRFAYNDLGVVAEGGGAVGIAPLVTGSWRPSGEPDGPVVAVLSGGNLALETLRRVVAGAG